MGRPDLGATVSVDGDRLHIEAPGPLPDDLLDALRDRKQDILSLARLNTAPSPAAEPLAAHVLAYREAVHQVWTLMADPEATTEAATQARDEEIRLRDDFGEPSATRFRQRWAVEWWKATRRCPWCGEPGEFHDQPQGGAR